jgi:hypothetical protein
MGLRERLPHPFERLHKPVSQPEAVRLSESFLRSSPFPLKPLFLPEIGSINTLDPVGIDERMSNLGEIVRSLGDKVHVVVYYESRIKTPGIEVDGKTGVYWPLITSGLSKDTCARVIDYLTQKHIWSPDIAQELKDFLIKGRELQHVPYKPLGHIFPGQVAELSRYANFHNNAPVVSKNELKTKIEDPINKVKFGTLPEDPRHIFLLKRDVFSTDNELLFSINKKVPTANLVIEHYIDNNLHVMVMRLRETKRYTENTKLSYLKSYFDYLESEKEIGVDTDTPTIPKLRLLDSGELALIVSISDTEIEKEKQNLIAENAKLPPKKQVTYDIFQELEFIMAAEGIYCHSAK